jgi:opacity protein-like surface antigen
MRPPTRWVVVPVLFALLSVAAGVPEAGAADNYLLVKAGAYTPEASDLDGFDTGFNGELAIGRYILPFLSLELEGGYFESKNGPSKLSVYPLTLGARLRIPLPIVKPYAIGGGGAYFATLDTPVAGSRNDTAFGYFAGAGVDFKILVLLVNIEAKYLWAQPSFSGVDTNINGAVVTLGVGLEF